MLQKVLTAFVVIYLLKKAVDFWQACRSIDNLPGYRTLWNLNGFVNNLVTIRVPGLFTGRSAMFRNKHAVHQWAGWDIYSQVAIWPKTKVNLNLADAAAIKEVTSARSRFPKPVEQYAVLSIYGHNIVASEGEDWKRYRKISAPAFSDRNNKMVWEETVKIMMDLFENHWGDREVIAVDHCLDVTLPIALFVIGVAGFGRKMTWREDAIIPPGHKLSFKDALHLVATYVHIKIMVPEHAMKINERTREIALAFDELKEYMAEMIEKRSSTETIERHDLFSSLLEANKGEFDQTEKLTAEELMGNIFIFLVAGHETTAHTLCFTFALLALYPDEQEKLYQHIKSILPDGQSAAYETMPLLTRSMAVFYETLRMFPPVNGIPKYSAEDTTLTVKNLHGETRIVPVPKGTGLVINTPALHYNPRYWEDPHSFKPERFMKPDWNKDAFLPFSAGARACIGRRFFETEGIAVLTMLVSKYKITVKEEPGFAHETFEQRRERIFRCQSRLTLTLSLS